MVQRKQPRHRAQRPEVTAFARACGPGFELLFEQNPLPMWIYSARTARFLEVNEAAVQAYGYSRNEFLAKSLYDIRPPDERERLRAELGRRDCRRTGFRRSLGWRHLRKDGSTLWVDIHSLDLHSRGAPMRLAIVHDISEMKRSEEAVARLYRMSTVLSGVNGLVVRARSHEELFREACRLAVEKGGFLLAWILVVDGDRLRPVACHGSVTAGLDTIGAALQGRGLPADSPVAVALRTGQPVACNDIDRQPGLAACCAQLGVSGVRSSLAQPLFVGGRVAGCLCLYASETGVFTGEEMKLLGEVAGDISYSMEFISRDEKLDYIAFYDPVTHLANRSLLTERLAQFTRAAREVRQRLAVLLLDLQRFGAVNTALGREGGDAVLKAVAERLQGVAGGPANLARVSGGQFGIVVPALKTLEELTGTLQDPVWWNLGGPIRHGGAELQLNARLGVAIFPDDGDEPETLLRNAEAALQQAKAQGERFLLYTKEMTAAIHERHSLELRLRRAQAHGEFVLYYQPKLSIPNGRICGAEALIRWNSPELGVVPPARFIPVLEDMGLIVEVGRQALREAADAVMRWSAQGLAPLPVSVNVSPLQLRQADFVQTLRDAIGARAGRNPHIELEVTESMLLGDTDAVIRRLRRVREMGVPIAIDDFGTGYSSLSYLPKLPIDAVKIDRSFITGLADNADTMSIVSTIISLAHSMGLRVIAEGVETHEQLRFLRMLKCDEMQGFLISKSLPEHEFVALLRRMQQAPADAPSLGWLLAS